MSDLSEALPASIYTLEDTVWNDNGPFAIAIYNQWTGVAPSWFSQIPSSARSFLLYDYLPNYLEEAMTLHLDQSTSSTASPAASPTSGPSSTEAPSTFATATRSDTTSSVNNHTAQPSATALVEGTHDTTKFAVGTVVPVMSLVMLGDLILLLVTRRRRDRTRWREARVSGTPHPLEPEKDIRRWSETTRSTTKQKLPASDAHPRYRRFGCRQLLTASRFLSEAPAQIATFRRAQSSPAQSTMSPRRQRPIYHIEKSFRLAVSPPRCMRSRMIEMI